MFVKLIMFGYGKIVVTLVSMLSAPMLIIYMGEGMYIANHTHHIILYTVFIYCTVYTRVVQNDIFVNQYFM